MMKDRLAGYEVERTGRGHDYVRKERNLFTGKVTKTEYVEVKSSKTAPLSPLQKKTKKKKKGNYKVVREDPFFF
ncbi:MAG: hypothetical protein QHG99_05760 [Methanomicrobiales archaeon]|nr:hypothetical protein [Methanomicrobiales archaeon]